MSKGGMLTGTALTEKEAEKLNPTHFEAFYFV